MLQYFNYFRAVNLISLIDKQLIGSVFSRDDENHLDDDRGFGKVYKWKNVTEGFDEAKKTEKPILLIVHHDSCPACLKLREKFSKSTQLIDLSSRFVMVNVPSGSDSLSADMKFQPDGKYVPRIIFYTSHGEIIEEAYNRQATDSKYRYFYSNPNEIIKVMQIVLEDYK